MGRSYHLTTFGCQMNEHDSERMKGMLESLGYGEAPSRDEADLILFNTCSIREKADNRLVGHLGEAKRLKREDPERLIGVGGCWSQSMKERVFEQFPFVDVAFGPGQYHKLAEFLTSDSLTAQGYFEFEASPATCRPSASASTRRGFRSRRVATCRAPTASSRPLGGARSPAGRRAGRGGGAAGRRRGEGGHAPGQNVCSYGRDLPKGSKTPFAELLALIDAVDGIERIRYTSPHPKDIREDVIRAHAELPSVCEHIHLPLQSGSSRILKAMKRTYNRRRYLDRVAMIRELVPDCALTTDIIVGFPGETEADFEETLEVVEEVRYDSAFTFIFSPRRETLAADLPDQLPHEVKRERMERLVDAADRDGAGAAVRRAQHGGAGGGRVTHGSRRLRGRTRHNKTVNFTGLSAAGELTQVDIASATGTTLAGAEALWLGP